MQTSLQFDGAFSVGASQRSKWWDSASKAYPGPQYNYAVPNFYEKPKSQNYRYAHTSDINAPRPPSTSPFAAWMQQTKKTNAACKRT